MICYNGGRHATCLLAVFVSVLALADARARAQHTVICTMNADGSEPKVLVKLPEHRFHGSASWSHDGKRLGFDAYPDSDWAKGSVFVAAADGQNPVSIGYGARPDWSPDDKQIAFFIPDNHTGPDKRGIWVMNADGQARVWLAAGQTPRWAPDGGQICFCRGVRGANNANVLIYDMIEGNERKLFTEDWADVTGACWSPDGERLAVIGTRKPENQPELCLVNADGAAESMATRYSGNLGYFPSWSPDGAQLAFFIRMGNYDAVHVARDDSDDPPTELPGQVGFGMNWDPSWSPDSERLVFSSTR